MCATLLPTPVAFAWGNGGDSRLSLFSKTATATPDISSETSFTLNVLPVVAGSGYGFGTHDFFLEQAIAQAIKSGADVSWINLSEAQLGTSDPDKKSAVKSRFPWGGDWHGTPYAGKAPRDVGIIYKEIVTAMDKGDEKTASRKLGWLAHLLCDLTQPMHVVTYSRYIPSKRQHIMHLGAEYDLDYYMKYSIQCHRNKWPTSVETVLSKYLPGASTITSATTVQDVRKVWFGGSYAKASKTALTARKAALDIASYTKKTYGKNFWINWAKTWKDPYVLKPADGQRNSRGTGTKYLVSNAPGMLKYGATKLATLITQLSDDAFRTQGIDQLATPKITVTAPKRPTLSKSSKTGKKIRAAKGKKRAALEKKYLKAPAKLTWKATVTVKNTSGSAVGTVPLTVKWLDAAGKTLSSKTVWTDSKGKVKLSAVLKTPKKKAARTLSIAAKTSNLKTQKKGFTIDPKKYTRKLK
jgi:hypothetical protein